ncbi:MAG: hypothetical protein H6713_30065 [Myxococcales bacterium]|nr:hypothetical protein [Myxococcales bacterium]
MNFFGHVTVARWFRADPAFALGAMLPDFVSMARLRLAGVDDERVAAGVELHHRTDDAFHYAPSFLALMDAAQERLEDAGLPRGPAMACAHVGVELLLDGWLADQALADGARDLELYRAALALEPVALRWRAPEHDERWATLRSRLRESPLPVAYGAPDFVAERLVWILSRRPRLAVDEAGARELARWAPDAAASVRARAPELIEELRGRLEWP